MLETISVQRLDVTFVCLVIDTRIVISIGILAFSLECQFLNIFVSKQSRLNNGREPQKFAQSVTLE